jgi:hypothetical protein
MSRRLVLVGAITALAIGVLAPAAMAGEEKVTICHKPGTPAENTLVVAAPAVDAHLAHGDTLQECGYVPVLDACEYLVGGAWDGEYATHDEVTLRWVGDEEAVWVTLDPAGTTPAFQVTLGGMTHDSNCTGQSCSLGLFPEAGDADVGWTTVSGNPLMWDVYCYHQG